MQTNIEIWRTIPSFPLYSVSNLGRVKRSVSGKGSRFRQECLSGQKRYIRGKLACITVTLRKDGRTHYERVHRLVLEAFTGACPDGMECCHNDGDPSNNALSNLRWDTHKSNVEDSVQHGTKAAPPFLPGQLNGFAKISDFAAQLIRDADLSKRGEKMRVSRLFGISHTHLRRIRNATARAVKAG